MKKEKKKKGKKGNSNILFILNFIMLSIISFYSNAIYSQDQNVKGVYYNSSKGKISINDTYFVYLNTSNDTLAICKYKELDNNYLEITGSNPHQEALKGSYIKQFCGSIGNDSIRLTFNIPNYDISTDSLLINISFGEDYLSVFSSFNLTYSKCNKSITICRPFSHHICYISIYKPFNGNKSKDNMYGSYYGIHLLDNLLKLTFNGYNDDYEIYLPSISDSLFKYYYIEGEILRLNNDTIYWRGHKWSKNNNTNDITPFNCLLEKTDHLTRLYRKKGNDVEEILLSDSIFVYLLGADTMAKCRIVKTERGFMEIVSDDPCKRALFNSSIKNIKENIDSNLIRFTFIIPNYHKAELLITISFIDSLTHDGFQQFTYKYSKDNNSLCIPRDRLINKIPSKCYLSISLPDNDYIFSNVYGSIYGIRYINNFLEIILNGYNDNYEIALPAISVDLFSRYNIEGDYILKRKNKIFWRGSVWKRYRTIHQATTY